jgi:hypothetical protein
MTFLPWSDRLFQHLVEFLHVFVADVLKALSELFVFGARFFAYRLCGLWRALGGIHPNTLALLAKPDYLLHVVIRSANMSGFFRLLKRHENSLMYKGK